MKKSKGFSFLELLMVVAVIAILAGMAVPHLHRIKMTSQEKTALATLRTMFEAQALHHSRFQIYGQLNQLVSNEFIDNSLSSGAKSGYQYSVTTATTSNFGMVAVPIEIGVSGEKGFYVDETGVLRYTDDGSPPGSSSPPWQ